MPYIGKPRRKEIDVGWPAQSSGELNYCITRLIMQYVDGRLAYSAINDVLGALEGAKLEFYRRVVAPYEDKKMRENGDVY